MIFEQQLGWNTTSSNQINVHWIIVGIVGFFDFDDTALEDLTYRRLSLPGWCWFCRRAGCTSGCLECTGEEAFGEVFHGSNFDCNRTVAGSRDRVGSSIVIAAVLDGNCLSQNVSTRSQQKTNGRRFCHRIIAGDVHQSQCRMNRRIVHWDTRIELVKIFPRMRNLISFFPLQNTEKTIQESDKVPVLRV